MLRTVDAWRLLASAPRQEGKPMRPRAALAALVFVPFLAVAQDSTPEATRPGADWSFGTGISFDVFTFPTPPLVLGAISSSSTSVPFVTASLERRLSGRTWLVVGVAGIVTRSRADVPAGGVGFARDDARQFYVTGGARRTVTRAGAPVEVSALFLAEAGVIDADQHSVVFTTDTRQEVTSWLAGANVGIAVDRELTGGLSLRVASPLLGARYYSSRLQEPGQPDTTGSGVSVRALLAPRLELRLAF
jgi:hypothetical protein